MRAAEKPGDVILRILAPLMADYRYWHSIQLGNSTDDRQIVSEHAITVQFNEVRKYQLNQIKRRRSLMVPSQMHFLSGR